MIDFLLNQNMESVANFLLSVVPKPAVVDRGRLSRHIPALIKIKLQSNLSRESFGTGMGRHRSHL